MVFGTGSICFNAGKILKSQDDVCPTISSSIHLDGDEEQKTRCGGIVTLVIKMLVIYMVVSNGIVLVLR